MTSEKDEWLSSHNTPEEADEAMWDLSKSLRKMQLTDQYGVYRKLVPNSNPPAYGVYLSKY